MSAPAAGPAAIPAPGFADPTREAQTTFRAVLEALARPGSSFALTGPLQTPAALGPALGAVLLTLLDEECTAWLGGSLAHDLEVEAWLAFHTGVRRTLEASRAGFVVTTPAALPQICELAQGSDEDPHASATVVLDVRGCTGPHRWRATGPGIDGQAMLRAPWARAGFLEQWDRNTATFPRGVDLLVVGEGSVSALPRTTRLQAADDTGTDTDEED